MKSLFILLSIVLSYSLFAKFDKLECNELQAQLLLKGVDRMLAREKYLQSSHCNSRDGLLKSIPRLEQCVPSGDNCLFYRCLDNSIHYRKCQDNNYAWRYGLFYCYTFNCKTAPKISPRGSAWIAEINQCIQAHIKNWVLDNPYGECKKVSEIGHDAHTPCYNHSDFCSLKVTDQIKIGMTPTLLDFIKPIALKQAYNIGIFCGSYFANKAVDSTNKILTKWRKKFGELLK